MRGACVALVTIVALTSCSRRDKAATDESQSPSVVAVARRDLTTLRTRVLTARFRSLSRTLCAALTHIKANATPRSISFVCVVAAPEGVERLAADHHDVPVFTAALDRQLNEQGFILPGLGDFGDRLHGTV